MVSDSRQSTSNCPHWNCLMQLPRVSNPQPKRCHSEPALESESALELALVSALELVSVSALELVSVSALELEWVSASASELVWA